MTFEEHEAPHQRDDREQDKKVVHALHSHHRSDDGSEEADEASEEHEPSDPFIHTKSFWYELSGTVVRNDLPLFFTQQFPHLPFDSEYRLDEVAQRHDEAEAEKNLRRGAQQNGKHAKAHHFEVHPLDELQEQGRANSQTFLTSTSEPACDLCVMHNGKPPAVIKETQKMDDVRKRSGPFEAPKSNAGQDKKLKSGNHSMERNFDKEILSFLPILRPKTHKAPNARRGVKEALAERRC